MLNEEIILDAHVLSTLICFSIIKPQNIPFPFPHKHKINKFKKPK